MRYLRIVLTVSFLAASLTLGLGCEKTPSEEAEEASETMEEAKEKANVKPSGTEAEQQDTPIEGTPEEVFGEMRREIDAYQDKIQSSSKNVPKDLETKISAIEAQIDQLDNSLTVGELQGDEIDEKLSSTIAQVKKEWNQTKRQVDVALGTTESETNSDQQ